MVLIQHQLRKHRLHIKVPGIVGQRYSKGPQILPKALPYPQTPYYGPRIEPVKEPHVQAHGALTSQPELWKFLASAIARYRESLGLLAKGSEVPIQEQVGFV